MKTINSTRMELIDRSNWEKISQESRYRVNEFAKQFGLSPRQLERFMQNQFGLTPKAFLREFQMKRALELLGQSEHSLKEISYKTGFKRFEGFCAKFKQCFGVPPGTWRAQNGAVSSCLQLSAPLTKPSTGPGKQNVAFS